MSCSVGELAASLVREFLSRKGLKSTLAVLDEELPRSAESISNRLALAKALHIEKLMKRNKEINNYRTMLEVIVHSLTSPKTITSLIEASPTSSHDHSLAKCSHAETPPTNAAINSSPSTNINPFTTSGNTSNDKRRMSSLADQSSHVSDGSKFIHSNPITTNSFNSTSSSKHQHSGSSEGRMQLTHSSSESKVKSTASKVDSKSLQPRSQSVSTKLGAFLASPTTHDQNRDCPRAHGHASPQGGRSHVIHGTDHGVGGGSSRNRWHDGGTSKKKSFKPRSIAEFVTEEGKDCASTLQGNNDERTTAVASPPAAANGSRSGKDGVREKRHVTVSQQVGRYGDIPIQDQKFNVLSPDKKPNGQSSLTCAKTSTIPSSTDGTPLLCQDLEDFDLTIDTPPRVSLSSKRAMSSIGQPISLETAKALRVLLFGNAKGPSFSAEWRRQNFFFCDLPGLEYGLIQHKGGPCGVLACLQAYLLKHLLFTDTHKKNHTSSCPQPTHNLSQEQRTEALIAALANILWRAGNYKSAVLALPSMNSTSNFQASGYKPDRITEHLVLHTFDDLTTLKQYLCDHLSVLQDVSSSGCISFLISVILSRGIERVTADMDEPTCTLIGSHGYCTQEMINLLLSGVAVSNVFDGQIELDSGGSKKHVLKGILHQSDVGFLSLFEHYQSCTVGSHYKEPLYPIWVVCSESHFSVLFSLQRRLLIDWQLERRFGLYYFDGLANQEEEIRLSIDTTEDVSGQHISDAKNLVSPLEHCIRTKWTNAVVDWNGYEPIL